MNIESLSDALGQHYTQLRGQLRGMEAAVAAGEWDRCRERAAALNELLGRHIRFEEGEIFPVVFAAARGGAGIERRLRAEHEQLRNLAIVLGLSSPAHDPSGWRQVLDELESRVGEHIESEAAALTTHADRVPAEMVVHLNQRLTEVAPPVEEQAGHFLDVSGMDPPGPYVRIMEELDKQHLPLRVRIHREPLPLYAALAERGLAHSTRQLDDGCFEIVIRPASVASGNA